MIALFRAGGRKSTATTILLIITHPNVVVNPFPTIIFQPRHPFTAPMVSPFTKYLCTNGYSSMIGPVVMTVMAIFIVS